MVQAVDKDTDIAISEVTFSEELQLEKGDNIFEDLVTGSTYFIILPVLCIRSGNFRNIFSIIHHTEACRVTITLSVAMWLDIYARHCSTNKNDIISISKRPNMNSIYILLLQLRIFSFFLTWE